MTGVQTCALPIYEKPAAKVRRLIEVQLSLLEGQRELAEVITVNLRQSTRLLRQYASQRFGEYLAFMASVIADGQREGAFRKDISANVMARTIFGALDGVTLTWALGEARPGALRRAARQIADVLLAGLEPRADGAESVSVQPAQPAADSEKASSP